MSTKSWNSQNRKMSWNFRNLNFFDFENLRFFLKILMKIFFWNFFLNPQNVFWKKLDFFWSIASMQKIAFFRFMRFSERFQHSFVDYGVDSDKHKGWNVTKTFKFWYIFIFVFTEIFWEKFTWSTSWCEKVRKNRKIKFSHVYLFFE